MTIKHITGGSSYDQKKHNVSVVCRICRISRERYYLIISTITDIGPRILRGDFVNKEFIFRKSQILRIKEYKTLHLKNIEVFIKDWKIFL